MSVVGIQRTQGGVLTSATSVTLNIVNSAGAVILAPTVIAPTSAGVYSYTTTGLVAGSYLATWVFTVTAQPTETISRAFTVDAPVEINEGISLMELERRVARRSGPYRRIQVSTPGNTASALYAARLKSSRDLGSYEDQYILRRGLTWGDELVAGYVAGDRVRVVNLYTASTGILTPDRPWTTAPQTDEAVELHALDPDEELRPAVLEGLSRCFFWDTITITTTGNLYDINLTALAPWLTEANRIKAVSFAYPSQLLPPTKVSWWQPYRNGKDIWLRTRNLGLGGLTILALRPHSSLVNGEYSPAGANDDLDILYVDPDYATWAGVLELWKTVPDVLQPLAAQNMRPTMKMVADEFTKKSMTIVQQVPETLQLDYGQTDILTQIGNLAEPVT